MTGLLPNDRGFTLGDGLFETILADRGRLVQWDRHMARLANGCAALDLPAPEAARCCAEAEMTLAEAGLAGARAAVRLSWSAGPGGRGLDRSDPVQPNLVITAAAAPHDPRPITLATAAVRRNPTSPTSQLKTLAYLDSVVARRQARAAGADEALMLDMDGRLSCAAAANLYWIEADRIFTPALDCGVMAGTLRAALMDELEIAEVAASPDVLDTAEAVFLSNSLVGVQPVRRIDGRDFFVGHPLANYLSAIAAAL